jgi:hypothetical protein
MRLFRNRVIVWSEKPKEKRRGEAYDYYHVWAFVSVRT